GYLTRMGDREFSGVCLDHDHSFVKDQKGVLWGEGHSRCSRNYAEGHAWKPRYREHPVKLACHYVVSANVGAECLFSQQDMEVPVTLVEEPLAFHTGRDSAVKIISYLMELDAEAHDFPCILGCLEHAVDDRGVISTEHFCLLSKGNRDLLPPP